MLFLYSRDKPYLHGARFVRWCIVTVEQGLFVPGMGKVTHYSCDGQVSTLGYKVRLDVR